LEECLSPTSQLSEQTKQQLKQKIKTAVAKANEQKPSVKIELSRDISYFLSTPVHKPRCTSTSDEPR
jgi:hypothetical protein